MELTAQEITDLKRYLPLLRGLEDLKNIKEWSEKHLHDGLSSTKIPFDNISFNNLSQLMRKVSLEDDGIVVLPKTYGVIIAMAGTVDEAFVAKFSTDGSVVLLSNTTNVDDADTDGSLCIYDTGTTTSIKNRLGSTKEIRYIIFS